MQRQQQHWQHAASVRDGRAPACDPDQDRLRLCEPGARHYTPDEAGRLLVKRLEDGWWQSQFTHPEPY